MTTNEIILACLVGVPFIFAIGRYSNRITWFHTQSEEKYTVKEFLHGRE